MSLIKGAACIGQIALHDMFVYRSRLGRVQGTKNGTLTPHDSPDGAHYLFGMNRLWAATTAVRRVCKKSLGSLDHQPIASARRKGADERIQYRDAYRQVNT